MSDQRAPQTMQADRATTGSGFSMLDFGLDPTQLSRGEIRGVRIAMVISGLLALALGIIVLAQPAATLAVVAVLLGLYFLVSGVIRVVRGLFTHGAPGGRVLSILFGVLLIVAGIFAMRNPLNSLVVLGLIIGIAWIIEGIAVLAETASDSSRWPGLLLGIVSLIAGIVVLFAPLQSLAALVLLVGVFLIVSGIVQVIESFIFGRRAMKAMKQTAEPKNTGSTPTSLVTD
ncbi:MAG: HdeD family acid-resistance protein [Cryobacterium sp.]